MTGPSSPEAPPAPKPPERIYTREMVVKAFNETFDDFKITRTVLTPQDEQTVKTIQSAKERTIDKGQSRARNKFTNAEGTQEFTTLEGVPIDKLLDHLRVRIESPSTTPEEMAICKERWDILNAHKKPLINKLSNPSLRLARTQQEAVLISQVAVDTAGEEGYWNMAVVELNGRFELVLPPKPKAPEPPKDTLPPEGVHTDPPPEPPIDTLPPEGESTETLPPTPPTVEDVVHEVAIINRTEDVAKRARQIAEDLLREKLKGRNIFRRMKYRIAEEYYRQKFTKQAYDAMLEHGNTYLTMESVGSSLRVLNADADRTHEIGAGNAKITEIQRRLEARMRTEGIATAEGPLKQQLLESIITPVLNGTLSEPQQVQRALAAFIRDHAGDPTIAQFFGSDQNMLGRASEYFATDLLDMGRTIKADYDAHGQSMEWLDQHINIRLSSPEWSESGGNPKLSRTDRMIKWAQSRRKTGAVLNPAVIGALSSLATFGILRAPGRVLSTFASIATPGVGMLSGGMFAAFRRNYDLKVDRSAHQRDRARGLQIPDGSRQRERLEQFAYDTASVTDLINGGGVDAQINNEPRRSVAELVGSDLTVAANQQALVSRMAEIEERLDYSGVNRVDLITFESGTMMEQGRLALIEAIISGRRALRTAGVDVSRIDIMRVALVQRFESNQADRDKAFKRFRLRSSLANGAFGSAAGLVSGLVVQEGVALGMRSTGHGVGQTFLEKAVGYEGGNKGGSRTVDVFRELAGRGGSYDPGAELRFNIDPTSHTVQITDIPTGKSLLDTTLKIGDDGHMIFDGKIPPELQDRLQTANFDILDRTGPPQEITRVIDVPGTPTTHTEVVGGPQAVEQWRQIGTHYDQQQWYRNDTPGVYDLNEHRAYTIKQGDTLILDMSRMHLGTESGLSPNPIDVQNVIQSKEAGFSFKIPGGGHHQTVWIPESADGVADGLLHLDPNDTTHMVTMGDGSQMSIAELSKMIVNQNELAKYGDGDIGTEYWNRREVFNLGANGRRGWWEVGRMTDQNGQKVLQTFATGRGASDAVGVKTTEIPGVPTTRTIVETIPGKPSFELVPPTVTEVTMAPPEIPLIPIPFAPRHPLERMNKNVVTPLPPEYFGYPAEYGMVYETGFGTTSVKGYTDWLKRGGYYPTEEPYIKRDGRWVHADGSEVKRDVVREKDAIRKYLNGQNAGHKAMVEGFAASLPAMEENCRVAVIIPAYLEGKNIYHTLEEWKNQYDSTNVSVDPSLYEIDIIVNGPQGYTPDNTLQEAERFKSDNPNVRVNIIKTEVPYVGGNVGLVRKIITDVVLSRSLQRSDAAQPLYIESEDADLLEIDRHAISNLIQKFDERPYIDALRGKQDLSPRILMQNDLLFYDRRIERFVEYLLRDYRLRPDNNENFDFYWNRNITGGWNSSFTAEAYALIGGYQPAQVGEDVDIGRRISVMRGLKDENGDIKPNVNTIQSIHNVGQSNPRRFIHALLKKQPTYADFTNEETNREIRSRSNNEMIAMLDYGQRISSENVQEFERILTNARRFFGWKVVDKGMQELLFRRLTLAIGLKKYKIITNPDGTTTRINGPLKQEGADKNEWRSDYSIKPDGSVVIDNIDNLRTALEEYRGSHKPYDEEVEVSEAEKTLPVDGRARTKTLPASPPTPTGTETPPPAGTRPRIPTETTPEGAKKDLAQQMNELLLSEVSDNSEVELTSDGMVDLFKKELASTAYRLENANIKIDADRLNFVGAVKGNMGTSNFDITIIVNPAGQLSVTSHTVNSTGAHRAGKGKVETSVTDLPNLITAQIKSRIPAEWDVDGFEIVDGKLSIKFKKNGTPTPPSSEPELNVAEAKFVVGKSYVSESGRTYQVTGVRIDPNGTKRILYKFSGGGLNGKGNFSEGRWNEYIDGGRLKPEVVEAESTADLGEIPDESKGAFATEANIFHPEVNEDSVVVDAELGFLGVFDGVGGGGNGDIASGIAMKQTKRHFGNLPKNPTAAELYEAVKQTIMDTSNERIEFIRANPKRNGEKTDGIGTTGSVAKIFEQDGRKYLAVLHAGDSRVYIVRKDGTVKQITQDHSKVNGLVQGGLITSEEGKRINEELDEFTTTPPGKNREERIANNPTWEYFLDRNIITKSFAKGKEPADYEINGLPDDAQYILATSDGVHDNLTKTEIEEICKKATNAKELAALLVQKAKVISTPRLTKDNIRTKADDITAAVLAV